MGIKEAIKDLKEIVGSENILTAQADLIAYSLGKEELKRNLRVVVTPVKWEQISKILKVLNKFGIKSLIVGGGSFFLRDLSFPDEETAIISTTKMHNVTIERNSLTVKCEVGATIDQVNKYLSKFGLELPFKPFFKEIRTIGGCIAQNVYGFGSLKYGFFGKIVKELKVSLPRGDELELVESSKGHGLLNLMIGGLGKLGFIAEALVKVKYQPKERKTIILRFKSPLSLIRTVSDLFTIGLDPRVAEFMHQGLILDICTLKNRLFDPNGCNNILILEFEADEGLTKKLKLALKIARDIEGTVEIGKEVKETLRIRENVLPILVAEISPFILFDVHMPVKNIPGLILNLNSMKAKLYLFGHLGGPIHLAIPVKPKDDLESIKLRINSVINVINKHGGKILDFSTYKCPPRIKREVLKEELKLIREVNSALKSIIDPHGILNIFW